MMAARTTYQGRYLQLRKRGKTVLPRVQGVHMRDSLGVTKNIAFASQGTSHLIYGPVRFGPAAIEICGVWGFHYFLCVAEDETGARGALQAHCPQVFDESVPQDEKSEDAARA